MKDILKLYVRILRYFIDPLKNYTTETESVYATVSEECSKFSYLRIKLVNLT